MLLWCARWEDFYTCSRSNLQSSLCFYADVGEKGTGIMSLVNMSPGEELTGKYVTGRSVSGKYVTGNVLMGKFVIITGKCVIKESVGGK